MRASGGDVHRDADTYRQAKKRLPCRITLRYTSHRVVPGRVAWVVFWIIAVVGVSCRPTAAAIYHVDAVNGSDSSDGVNFPWRTLARVNAQSFQPGDQILLHAGQTW